MMRVSTFVVADGYSHVGLYEKELLNVADVMTMHTHKIDSRYCLGSGLSKKQVNIRSAPHLHLFGSAHIAIRMLSSPKQANMGHCPNSYKNNCGVNGGKEWMMDKFVFWGNARGGISPGKSIQKVMWITFIIEINENIKSDAGPYDKVGRRSHRRVPGGFS